MDMSGSPSEEADSQLGQSVASKEMASPDASSRDSKGKSVKDEEQRTPNIRKFRRIDSSRRRVESAEKDTTFVEGEVKSSQEKQTGDGYEICGYELRTPQNTHALKILSVDDAVQPKGDGKSHSMRSKVQDEVMKILFGPPDAKTPDEDKYELVEQEVVTRGVGHAGVLFRFSMWATLGFITWVLGGRRARVGCSEFFPNVRERDPVPKVIIRRQKYSS